MSVASKIIMPYVFTQEIRKILAYRVDFWIQFVGGVLVQFGVAWFLWKAVFTYRGVQQIGPFTFSAMMLYYLLVPIVGRAIRGSEMGGIAEEIYMGTLTRYLVYPVSFFAFKLSTHLAHTAVFLAQGVLAAILFVAVLGGQAGVQVSVVDLLFAVSATLLGTVLHFALVSTIELSAFWADNVWSLVVIVRFMTGLLGGGMIPLSLFPSWMQATLMRLPFAYFMNFPVRCLLGRVTFGEWVAGVVTIVAWGAVFLALHALVWRRGKYRYTGVGI